MKTTPETNSTEPDDKSPVLRPALVLFLVLSLLTGLLYPLLVTGVAQAVFPHQANGSLVQRGGLAVGSELIGQPFSQPGHFWSRPSATGPMAYNGGASSGSNLGPSHPALAEAVQARIAALRAADPGNTAPVPVDLVTASASGLDPHISLAAARYQVARVARVRGLAPEQLNALVDQHTEGAWLGFLGEARVNVLALNLALDAIARN
ncbi:potassium-transporting ATPase subunit KdpC [Hydrogenophaga sp. A37]|uniref:potassium-transporting ATPase subunit KdpC n=1 Tax=Hydrogenophaga sp. A37 TaxID=1945864 RepID=UPI000985ED6E|nr:potassium-transporting ATPase subunit KdpC [Hydrogenophaga sp. A37]OOG89337.1 potassium-transporting ATPase subunit C [Hydrogenophaga sp. A37]